VKYSIFFIPFLISELCFGQAPNLELLGSAGNSSIQGSTELIWSTGEPIVTTAVNNGYMLTQGFIQHDINILMIEENEPTNIYLISNPVSETAIIKSESGDYSQLDYYLIDSNGKRIQMGKLENPSTYISFQNLCSATYFLHISKENKMLKQKIEELNQERYKLELYVMRLEREINYFKSKQP
jgi:hypothetical protein